MVIGYDTVLYVVIGIVGFTTIFLKPQVIIYLLLLLRFIPFLSERPVSVGPVNVFAKDLLLLIYCCYATATVFIRSIKNEKILDLEESTRTILWFIAAYMCMHLLFIVFAVSKGVPLDSSIRRYLTFADHLYFFFPILFLRGKNQIRNLLIYVVILALLYPIWQLFIFLSLESYQLDYTSSGTVRLGSGGLSIAALGMYILLVWKNEVKYYLVSVIPIVSIILAGHRSALLAIAMGLIFTYSLSKKLSKFLLSVYISSFAIVIALIGLEIVTGHSFYDDALQRSEDTFSKENPTTIARVVSIEDNWRAFKKKPIAGIGYYHEELERIFSYQELNRELFQGSGHLGAGFNVIHPHNFLMRYLSNTGIIGTFLILSIIVLILKRCYMISKLNEEYRNIGTFLFSFIVYFMVFSLMNTNFFFEGDIFWATCGAAVLFTVNKEQNEANIAPTSQPGSQIMQ